MEHAKTIGFLVGMCVKLATPKCYINELSDHLTSKNEAIDIKKRFTHEHGSRSKVLIVHAIEPEAKEIDEMLCNLRSPRCQCMSCRNSTSQERVPAMHHDEMKTVRLNMKHYLM